MKRIFFLWAFLLLALTPTRLWAARQIGFETDALNRVYPASFAKSVVFSPGAFEIDCAVIAESLETIPKAGVSETMGVVLDFEGLYAPIVEAYAGAATNGLSITTARGFCVPELKEAAPAFRQQLERVYGVEVMRLWPSRGAEAWFRAAMDGEMEDFSIAKGVARSERFSYYDLVSVAPSWVEPFPIENTRKIKFRASPEAEPKSVTCISDVRVADTYETTAYTLLRLPLKDDAWFYAMLPKEGHTLSEAREDLSSLRIDHLLTVMKSVAEPGVAHGPCAIVLPRLNLRSRLSFTSALSYFRIPSAGLVHVAGTRGANELVQIAKFKLFEQGPGEQPLLRKSPDRQVSLSPAVKKLVFNRPFIFFVYHEKTQTIPMAGQFCGEVAE